MRDLAIIHVDMDAFFASVEQLDRPELRGKPVVVGGPPHSRGVVAAASYEARRYGIFSALSSAEAYRRCPQAIFVPGRMQRYQEVSGEIMAILRSFTPLVEPLSLDEAYCDVGNDGASVGKLIKDRIREQLNLTASVGVSYNKFLAKLASDMDKPDGFTVIDHHRAQELLPSLPVRDLWGVGPKTAKSLAALGINTAGQLLSYPVHLLEQNLGTRTAELLDLARGIDGRRITPHGPAKSLGEEITFPVDTGDPQVIGDQLAQMSSALEERLTGHDLECRTVTLKVRHSDFHSNTRSHSFTDHRFIGDDILGAALDLLRRVPVEGAGIRLIGLSVSNLRQRGRARQLPLPLEEWQELGVKEL